MRLTTGYRRALAIFYGLWREGIPQNTWAPSLFGFGCFGVALLGAITVSLAFGVVTVYAPYYPAILVATLIAGPWSGLTTLLLGLFAGWATFEFSTLDDILPQATELTGAATFVVAAAVIVWVAAGYRRALRNLNENEKTRALLVRELQHRSANALMVVQSVVSQTLRDNKDVAQKINDRIAALAATDELVTLSESQTVMLSDILLAELRPHGETRIKLHGPAVELPATVARSVGLICHELATNAAKYGALSRPEGRLSVIWAVSGDNVQIAWRESDGPPVAPPARQGFGTYFIERLLGSNQGRVALEFHPEGVMCDITLVVAELEQGRSRLPQVEFPSGAPGLTSPK